MQSLKEYLSDCLIHDLSSKEKNGKITEAAIYSLNKEDIKFRMVKFINGELKEISTSEDKEEAFKIFEKMAGGRP